MTPSLLQQGLTLMLIGMGTVFVFLTVLVFAMTLMARVVARLPAQPVPATATARNDEEVAAISAAIRMHRQKQRTK